MLLALIGVLCKRCKIYEELNVSVATNNGSFIGTSTTNVSTTNNNAVLNGNTHNMTGGKLKSLVQKPCFKFVIGAFALCGIIAYSVFANMCYYKLHCEEIHPYIVFVPVSQIHIPILRFKEPPKMMETETM